MRKDLTDKKFGRLIAINYIKGTHSIRAKWKCLCDCGNYTYVYPFALTSGHTTSCGCRGKECLKLRTSHGLSKTKIYWTYQRMIDRCYNINCPRAKYYSFRGIKVCDRWLGEEGLINFVSDMGNPPSPKHSIDRIDVDGNYEPSNCRWATQIEQLKNRRPRKNVLK